MKNKAFSLITVLLSVFLFVSLGYAQKVEDKTKTTSDISSIDPAIITALKGEWKNQLNSILNIESIDSTTGQITGKYNSGSGTSGGNYALIGWVNTEPPPTPQANNVTVISFSVRWANATTNYGSVASWNGYYTVRDGKPTIVGQWLLSRANSSFVWDHIYAGQDVFMRKSGTEKNSVPTTTIDPAIIAALKGEWKNQLNSILNIESINSTTGQVTGKYRSGSGAGNDYFPMIGWINTQQPPTPYADNATVISFSVRWAKPGVNYGSVASWNGYYAVKDGKPTIVGQWLLSRANSSFVWDHTYAGQDIFLRP